MHCTRLAPELSATSSTDRIWIMASFLHVLLHEADDDEPLVAAQGAVLLDLDLVTGLVLVGLVVRLVAGARADVLAVQSVAAVADHLDHDRLLHLGADDPADHLATEAVGIVLILRLAGLRRRVLRHGYLASLFFAVDFLAAVFFGFASAPVTGAAFTVSAFAAFATGLVAATAAAPWRSRRSVITRARSRRLLRVELFSSTPCSSYITRPGRTFAAHSSTLPLPPPMRTSRGFLVTGMSGKTRIQS